MGNSDVFSILLELVTFCCLNPRFLNKSVRRKSIYPGAFIVRLVPFKTSSPKQRFTLNLRQLQENVAFNVGIEQHGRDSWLHHLNPMNQDKFILSKQVTYTSYKCIPNHKMTLIYSAVFVTMTSCSRYPIKS